MLLQCKYGLQMQVLPHFQKLYISPIHTRTEYACLKAVLQPPFFLESYASLSVVVPGNNSYASQCRSCETQPFRTTPRLVASCRTALDCVTTIVLFLAFSASYSGPSIILDKGDRSVSLWQPSGVARTVKQSVCSLFWLHSRASEGGRRLARAANLSNPFTTPG